MIAHKAMTHEILSLDMYDIDIINMSACESKCRCKSKNHCMLNQSLLICILQSHKTGCNTVVQLYFVFVRTACKRLVESRPFAADSFVQPQDFAFCYFDALVAFCDLHELIFHDVLY